jgi:histone deacetylase HOS3
MADQPLTRTAVILQPKGLLHRFIRHRDISTIVERPERLRAVCVGVAAIASRLQEAGGVNNADALGNPLDATPDLTDALRRLSITGTNDLAPARLDTTLDIITATNSTNLLTDLAVRFVHGEPEEYLNKLHVWASSSEDKIRAGESEIPPALSQGDLYCMFLSIYCNDRIPPFLRPMY